MWVLLSLYFALWAAIYLPIAKKVLKSTSPTIFLFISSIFLIAFMLIALTMQGSFPHVSNKFLILMFTSAIFDLVAFLLSLWAIKISPISLLAPISSFTPVFVTFIAMFTLHEIPTSQKLIGILTIVLGSYFLNITDVKNGLLAPFKRLFSDKGVKLAFIANFLWGITPVFQKQAIFQTSPIIPLFASFAGVIFVTLFITPYILKKERKQVLPTIKQNIGWLLVIGFFGTLGQLAAYISFSQTNVGYATAIFRLSTLFTILFGAIFFKEKRIYERLLGAIIMILGTLLLVL